ncbi:hypothetical protein [Terrihabitans sp. B22-R8]|uniref:hypothetical protein n=1 Tax=Terrihabitans sp. B22-R8 TaxID=3425128 RepID=UPI00403D12E7
MLYLHEMRANLRNRCVPKNTKDLQSLTFMSGTAVAQRVAQDAAQEGEQSLMSDERSDLLSGAPAIAAFLGIPERSARYRIASGQIPTFKFPGSTTICANRSTLTKWIADCEAAALREAGGGRRQDGVQ